MGYSSLGKPINDPFVDSFNGYLRDERLNAHWFLSLKDATENIEAWRHEHNHYGPHNSLKDMILAKFIEASPKDTKDESIQVLTVPGRLRRI